jgi:hypothetical protein
MFGTGRRGPSSRGGNSHFWRLGAFQIALIAGAGLLAFFANNRPADDPDPVITGSIAASQVDDVVLPDVPLPRARPQGEVDRASNVASTAPGFVTYDNRDMYGGDYVRLESASLSECEARCGADARCRAYTFNKWQGVCFLKSEVGSIRIEPQGITGIAASQEVKHAPQAAFIQKNPGRQFSDGAYKIFRSVDYRSCSNECLADAQCLGFNFDRAKRSCSLMQSLTKPTVASATDAGIKLQRSPSAERKLAQASHAPARRPPYGVHPLFDAVLKELARY